MTVLLANFDATFPILFQISTLKSAALLMPLLRD